MIARQTTLYLLLLALAVAGLFVGAAALTPAEVWDGLLTGGESLTSGVVRGIRLPRVLGGIVVGAALGMGGVGLQAAYRNRLAEPYLLGISSGAGFGLVLGALIGATGLAPIATTGLAALTGVLAALVTRRLGERTRSGEGLILAGVALNFVFLAWTLITTFAVDSPRLPTFVYFVFGSLATVTWPLLWVALPLVAGAGLVLMLQSRSLDLLSLGDDEATSLGIDVPRVVTIALVAVGVATGASVAVAGVVGFVGLLASLIGRQLFRPSHRTLLPTAAGLGAVFVLAADILIRGMFGQVEVPLGVITAAVGGPTLVLMLLRGRNES